MMEKSKTPNPCLFFLVVALSFAIITTSGKGETTTNQVPQNAGNNAPLSNSLPFAKPVGSNNGQRSQPGYQQQQDPNNPQETINQPLSGISQPYATTNQPNSGFNQPFNTINQPFGGRGGTTNPQGSMENADFYNGVTKDKSVIQGVALVSLVTLMVCFGF